MITFSAVKKQYGSRILYEDASFQIRENDRIGLVGPNGAGKTTVFRIIANEEGIDSGQVSVPDKLVVGYFSQDVGEMSGHSALEEVESGAGKVSDLAIKLAELEHALAQSASGMLSDDAMNSLVTRYGEVQAEFQALGGYDLQARAKEILTGLGIGPDDHDKPVESFSGGWKMRIALAKILALQPNVLLMDEPTNHLDVESIVWLEEWLMGFEGAIVMTSHDREFMGRICKRILEVANKAITNYSGDYNFYVRERDIRKTQLLAAHKRQNDMLAKEEEFISRFAARASHAAQVQSRVKKLEKMDRIEIPTEEKAVDFEFNTAPRSGNEVVKIEALGKTWSSPNAKDKLVFSNITGLVKRLDKVAVVGVNGAGKSTLLKIIAGETEASTGRAILGAGVKVGYFSQHSLDVLNPKSTVYEEVYTRVPNASVSFVRSLLGAFLFSGEEVDKKVSVLSGGEKSRVVLATILANPVNLLILDEPTNHLDIRSREILLEALKKFEGTVLIVSHDRHFLKALATRVFEVDRGEMHNYEGTYDEYLARTKKFSH